jgi:Phosphodiester glycosidase
MGLIKWSRRSKRNRWIFGSLIALLAIVVLFVALSVAIAVSPEFGAWGSDVLRHVVGERATMAIEGFFLTIADSFHRLGTYLGIGDAENPFAEGADDAAAGATTTTLATAEPPWEPAAVEPLGTLKNEGIWQPYLVDPSGQTVGYRTALQPDRKRLYGLAAVVAMDLAHTRLHFVLGYEEPYSKSKFPRPGAIPESELQSGAVLAAFNGGFKASNGHFGAMQDGNVALPAKWGLGTLVIYKDGRVAIGAWGKDLTDSPDMESWRQNGPLLISDGQMTPEVHSSDAHVWGEIYEGGIGEWRSAVGVSKDGRTLYFIVGPGLTTPGLAQATLQAGAWDAIQLDINQSWTRFYRIVVSNGQASCEPLMNGIIKNNRLVHPYSRDFFYLSVPEADTQSKD